MEHHRSGIRIREFREDVGSLEIKETQYGRGVFTNKDINSMAVFALCNPLLHIPIYGSETPYKEAVESLGTRLGITKRKKDRHGILNYLKELWPRKPVPTNINDFHAWFCDTESWNAFFCVDSSRWKALYFTFSFINHSCRANTMVVPCKKGPGKLVSIRDIRAGEEITTFYIPQINCLRSGELQMENLRSTFGFECECGSDHEIIQSDEFKQVVTTEMQRLMKTLYSQCRGCRNTVSVIFLVTFVSLGNRR